MEKSQRIIKRKINLNEFIKKELVIAVCLILIVSCFVSIRFAGNAVDEFGFGSIGPDGEKIECMQKCVSVGCEENNMTCRISNSDKCSLECGVEKEPEPANKEESCMQECVVEDCDKFDFGCQNEKKEECEEKCNMKGDAPDESEMSKEQLCITQCVAKVDPKIRCSNSKEGETGGEVCKKCAEECVYLYEGPCLGDDELKEKQKECETCEHCYGEPVMGDSGEGWECIIDVECLDASSEFGDEPGEGPGIGQEGFVAKTTETVGNIFEGIGDFFKGIFGRNSDKFEETTFEEVVE